MSSLAARLGLELGGAFDRHLNFGTATYPLDYRRHQNFTDGEGADQAEAAVTDRRTLGPSAFEDLDLANLEGGPFGTPVEFTAIKALVLLADRGNTNDLLLGGAASAPATAFFGAAADKARLKPGGMTLFVAPDLYGYTITDTARILRVANAGAGSPVSYTIVAIGVVGLVPPAGFAFVSTNGGLGFITTNSGQNRVVVSR